MRRACFIAGTLFLAPLLALCQDAPPRSNLREFLGLGAAPDAAAAKAGEPLYRDNCAACHGGSARGAQGPSLVRSAVVLHDDKGEGIGAVILLGRPPGMPAFPDLTAAQRYQISEYLHLQVELTANRGTYRETYSNLRTQATGDIARGKQFFQDRCTACHSAERDLAHVGTKYSQAATLLSRIAWPAPSGPRQVRIIAPDGEQVNGTLLHMDDFDISIQDAAGAYRSWPRAQVKVELADHLAGHRALLAQYSDADLHNITAYLATLK